MFHKLKDKLLGLYESAISNPPQPNQVGDSEDRRLYLEGVIGVEDIDGAPPREDSSQASKIVRQILDFNRLDKGIPPEERNPILLYIDSPGGDVREGFTLVDAIELSKTPIYTINMGSCYSMAFWILITGKRRFSLPSSGFMTHEPSGMAVGKYGDMTELVKFNQRFNEIIRKHVMKHGNMTPDKYDAVLTKDFYMMAVDALEYGFVDEIVGDIDTIL